MPKYLLKTTLGVHPVKGGEGGRKVSCTERQVELYCQRFSQIYRFLQSVDDLSVASS